MTNFQRQRLERQYQTLMDEWGIRSQKLSKLRSAWAIETSPAIKFQLEQQLASEEAQLKDLEMKLVELEAALGDETESRQSTTQSEDSVESDQLDSFAPVARSSEPEADDSATSVAKSSAVTPRRFRRDARRPRVNATKDTLSAVEPLRVFCSYAIEDTVYFEMLEKHLAILQRQGVIDGWQSRSIENTKNERPLLPKQLQGSPILLLMISANYLFAETARQEIAEAMALLRQRKINVVPILVRPVDWSGIPLRNLLSLPRDGRPLSLREDVDEALVEIAQNIRQLAEQSKGIEAVLDEPTRQSWERFIQHPAEDLECRTYDDARSRTIYHLPQVFKESGVPHVTFVEPAEFYLLRLALMQPGRGVVIEGPSGIGKTTALKEALAQLETAGMNFNVEVLSARDPKHVERLRRIDDWQSGIVAIDDFHLLDRDLGNQLANRLKYLADLETENKIVIVGIPHTRTRLIEVGTDIATRIEVISMAKTSDVNVEKMIQKGELALNVRFLRKAEIVSVADGSLNIAQILCSKLAAREGVMRTVDHFQTIDCDLETELERIRDNVMNSKYGEFVRAFCLLNGRRNQNCIRLLLELAKCKDGYLSLVHAKTTHLNLKEAIEEFRSQNHIDKLAIEYPKYSDFIFYDKHAFALVIDDPQLIFYLKQVTENSLRRMIGMSESQQRYKVFISYSRDDSEALKELQKYLKPLETRGLIDRWDDTRIKPGMRWQAEIKQAIDAAKIAIFLVSSNFLSSDFIAVEELPPLLQAAKAEGAQIISIILDPCESNFKLTDLSQFQTHNPPSQPLSGMTPHQRGETFDRLVNVIVDSLAL